MYRQLYYSRSGVAKIVRWRCEAVDHQPIATGSEAHRTVWVLLLMLGLWATPLCVRAAADDTPQPAPQTDPTPLKPRWQVGDRWVVETATLQIQVAGGQSA